MGETCEGCWDLIRAILHAGLASKRKLGMELSQMKLFIDNSREFSRTWPLIAVVAVILIIAASSPAGAQPDNVASTSNTGLLAANETAAKPAKTESTEEVMSAPTSDQSAAESGNNEENAEENTPPPVPPPLPLPEHNPSYNPSLQQPPSETQGAPQAMTPLLFRYNPGLNTV